MIRSMRAGIIFIIVGTIFFGINSICFAEENPEQSIEQINAEISRLENELEELYRIRDQLTQEKGSEEDNHSSEGLLYSGTGDTVLSLEKYDRPFLFEIDGNSEENYFGVIAYDENNNRLGSLVNTADSYHGRIYNSDSQSASILEIKAKGDWQIQVLPLETALSGSKGDTVEGNGDDVIILKNDKGECKTASITGNDNCDYFGVIGYNQSGVRTGSLVNTADAYSGNVMIDATACIFEVKAKGEWTITFE